MYQKGIISIFLSVLIMSILVVISAGIAALTINQIKTSSQVGHSVTAYYAAESGVERCLCDTRQGNYNCTNSCNYTNVSLDFNSNAKYTTDYNGSSPIESIGIFFNTRREIEVNW